MLRIARIFCLLVIVLAHLPHLLAAQDFTLEQILSAPFPSGLVAAPTEDAVAWVQSANGVRNIWVARSPEYQGVQVTAYAEDDGQQLTNLEWTHGGDALVFVRGGAPNRQGEIPNPATEALGVERAIWIVPVAGGDPRQLAEGSAPAVSPSGRVAAFLKGGAIWSVTLDDSATVEELVSPRGSPGSLRWSPDGSRLAFRSARGDHALIGVYDLGERTLEYLDPSVDLDGNPVWSQDGRRVAFIRIPNDRHALPFAPRREMEPWSIRVVDVATGAGREVWSAAPGRGSAFRGVVAENQLLWAAGDRIVLPWERDGWVHLYSLPIGGGEPTLLTPGAFEVEYVALSASGREVIYSSNQGDIDRRHLWQVPVVGGRPVVLTPGAGIEWAPTVTESGTVAFLASDARTPAHAEILLRDGRRPLAPGTMPRDFPSQYLVEPEPVVFAAADGMPIHGQLFLPRDATPDDPRPGVLFFHGGSRRQMLLGFHYMGYYHNTYALNQYLASLGYVVLSVNYRSGIGYGLDFREAIDYGARGASEYRDVVGAGLYLQSRVDVDPERIGLWGGSYGGYLTALGLARASDLFKAGVDFHGVHDWNVVIRNFVPSYDPAARAEVARLAYESSPMASVDRWRSPVLVIHADDDRNVPFSETVDLVAALRARGVEVEQLVFPDDVHGFLLHANWLAAYRATVDFFERRLKE
jgi:dipeptidyl aminopeptidase/acylaminoacyl peptidase